MMNLANKYMMRNSGESRYQPSGYAETVAMGVVDNMTDTLGLDLGIRKLIGLDKVNLEKLNEFMEQLAHGLDINERIYNDVRSILRVIKSSPVMSELYTALSNEDIENLCCGIITTIEISRPLVTNAETSNKTSFLSFLKFVFGREWYWR